MSLKSQTSGRLVLFLLAALCVIPSLVEARAVIWGNAHGMTGKALRDGLDFWGGGFLAAHGRAAMVFDQVAYQHFLSGLYGKLPVHMWSYPPSYLLLTAGFGWLAPWHAVLAFDALSLALLAFVLRLAGQPWLLILAVVASPASWENVLEGQNAALLTALVGGGLLLIATRPRLGGALIGLASIKPQLGLVLPFYLARRAPWAFLAAAVSAVVLTIISVIVFHFEVWSIFWHVTRPAMDDVLLTGKPKEFANGLISVFAALRLLGVGRALAAQALVSIAAMIGAVWFRRPEAIMVLAALGSPYLHDYDLLLVTLAVAVLLRDRLQNGFNIGEPVLFFLAWFGPGLLPWAPGFAHVTPLILLALLASAASRGRVRPCDSAPESSAGPLPIQDPPSSTAIG